MMSMMRWMIMRVMGRRGVGRRGGGVRCYRVGVPARLSCGWLSPYAYIPEYCTGDAQIPRFAKTQLITQVNITINNKSIHRQSLGLGQRADTPKADSRAAASFAPS